MNLKSKILLLYCLVMIISLQDIKNKYLNVDLFLINKNVTVEKSTYEQDIGLNLSSLKELEVRI